MSIRKPEDDTEPRVPESGAVDVATRRTTSRALFGEARVLLIEHEGETYALRRTRLGKLILTK